MLNVLENLNIVDESYEFLYDKLKQVMKIDGKIIKRGRYEKSGKDLMLFVKRSGLKEQIGKLQFDVLMRKPMMVFTLESSNEEYGKSKSELDDMYGIRAIILNNFAQAFSIGSWFIKDSCINANKMYWCNLFNGYILQDRRDMSVTLSNGEIKDTSLDSNEVNDAIGLMYAVLRHLMPNESNMGRISKSISNKTTIWEIDKAISTQGKSFSRALILLQEARRTGVISSKIDKYCSILECLYAINSSHKKNISNITAAYIGNDQIERSNIITHMREAYSVRSDKSHGDNLKYLKDNDERDLKKLSQIVDGYVRGVFIKTINSPSLNYGQDSESKAAVRKYFMDKAKAVYPDDYK